MNTFNCVVNHRRRNSPSKNDKGLKLSSGTQGPGEERIQSCTWDPHPSLSFSPIVIIIVNSNGRAYGSLAHLLKGEAQLGDWPN